MQRKTTEITELEARFNRLAEAWRKEASFLSFSDQRAAHWAYRKIIDMGDIVLPLIFREMETGGSDWRHALEILTGANPVGEETWGKPGAAKKAWLDWAQEQGYRW